MIHPTAIIHPKAKLDSTVSVGPYAVIDEGVEIGPNCRVGPHVYLTGNTSIGSHNTFHAGGVIGDAPQDVKYQGEPTRLRIGDHNVFREYVTVHRSNNVEAETVIGSRNLLMAHAHVGHNALIGNHVIIANGALVAGHVEIGDRAFISGNCLLHQYVRVGMLALMQGGAGISKDLPPYTVAHGRNGICGLNTIGLRRAGITSEERLELRRLYHDLFRRDGNLRDALADAEGRYAGAPARLMIEFVATSRRGVCADIDRDPDEETVDEED